jgi:hypothetical protein
MVLGGKKEGGHPHLSTAHPYNPGLWPVANAPVACSFALIFPRRIFFLHS